MLLTKKFIIGTIFSILIIALTNILAFYIFYTFYIKIYVYEKLKIKESVTIEYINESIKKQKIDDIDNIFSDSVVEFFELLETNKWKIPLDKQENIDIVINYLIKSWLTPKYIEEIIPTDNFKKVLEAFEKNNSPESKFLNRFLYSILITNFITIFIIILILTFFLKRTLSPINIATKKIKKLNKNISSNNFSGEFENIYYKNPKDEIWLLVNSINNLNSKLSLQNKIRTRLLADISHELKTPITSIQCYLEWIWDGVIELNKKNLDSISLEMNRLIKLVNKIMDFEKFDRQEIELNLSSFDAVQVLKNISETHKKILIEKEQRIKITWENFLEIKADKDLFMQISHNLIWNFLKYSWKKTQLNIIVNKKSIEFSDNWKWIKANEIPFLVEKFYQWNIEKTWDADFRWIWVWLSIVSKIIFAHGWRFEIKTDLDKGFNFKIFT